MALTSPVSNHSKARARAVLKLIAPFPISIAGPRHFCLYLLSFVRIRAVQLQMVASGRWIPMCRQRYSECQYGDDRYSKSSMLSGLANRHGLSGYSCFRNNLAFGE